MTSTDKPPPTTSRLRRDLGTVESYATLIGILIGAGIFKVTSDAWNLTGPSVIVGYAVLMPVILATSLPYAAYISTPLGREPGGEYLHISRTLGGFGIAYIGAWIKIISYVGAGAYLADALAGYLRNLLGLGVSYHLPIAVGGLVCFYLIHVAGIRWFGRMQVIMSALKLLAILVLIVPGFFAIRSSNYQPFVTHGFGGFAASLLPIFFAYAGFESVAQTAGEVKDSTRRLPVILLKGITVTSLIYILMSVVSFGVLPGVRLQASKAPMAEVASVYLPAGAAAFITFGAIMAIMTALNGTMLVPSRLAMMFVKDRLAPNWVGVVNSRTATPIRGLTLTLIGCGVLLLSGQLSLALNIAVFALITLYFIHSVTFLLLPRLNPELYREISIGIPKWLLFASSALSAVAMGAMILVQVIQDVRTLRTQSFYDRVMQHSLTSLELAVVWSIFGAGLYAFSRWMASRQVVSSDASL